jgi:deoxyadenosine/deoxycytidine kinase
MHIAIAGNIGSGKTTLTELLAEHYHWMPHYEELGDNPYILEFYNDMQRWAFHLQMFFLSKRFKQILEIKKSARTIVQDRTVFEDAHVFAANLRDMNLMSHTDFNTYTAIYDLLNALATPPDLLIYLRASVPTLLEQIQKRGREYEAGIRYDYLDKLNQKYETWIAAYPHRKIVVNVDETNFVAAPANLNRIIALVDGALRTGSRIEL